MKRKINKATIGIAIFIFVIIFGQVMLLLLRSKLNRDRKEQYIHNVFDEMTVNDCEGLKRAGNYKVYRRGVPLAYVSIDSNKLSEKVNSIQKFDWQGYTYGLGLGKLVLFRFEIKEADFEGDIIFAYNSSLDTLYIYSENTIPLEDREQYRDYLLGEIVVGGWLADGNSRYAEDYLGEFEIQDCLLPYEYCGLPANKPAREETIEHEYYTEQYFTWLDNDSLLCIQQNVDKPYGLPGVYFAQRSYGTDVGSTRFFVQKKTDESLCSFSDIVSLDTGFIEWLKSSGKVSGNLKKISTDREAGERSTLEMLEGCPAGEMAAVLENCEFYMEPGYLHFKFPYWNGEKEEPGWERNGNGLWRNWLTVKTEDIEEFLEVEIW